MNIFTSALPLSRAILASALFLVAFGGFAAVGWMTYAAISKAVTAHADISALSAESEALRRLASEAAATKESRKNLSELIIPAGGNVAFIGAVESLGKTARVGASVSSVSARPPAGLKPGKLDLSVRFSGSFAQTMHFLELLETLPFALSVGDLTLQRDGASWSGTVSLSALSLDAP